MTRIFFSDYGTDSERIAKFERVFRDLRAAGADICRTSRAPLDTVAHNLVLPNLIERSAQGAGITLHPNVSDRDVPTRIQAATFQYDHPRKSARDCFTSMYMYRQYIEEELTRFRPDLVVVWHQFNAYHYAIADWCRRENVPVIYGENGILPGSWCFEHQGQMGESWIARNPEAFAALPLRPRDRTRAAVYLKSAVTQRLNRKAPGLSVAEAGLQAALKHDPRPKILYAGINDFKTGLQPFTQQRSLLHSGDFISTELGLKSLLPLARKNGWHVLYKAHPSIKHAAEGLDGYEDCLTVVDKRVDLIDLLSHADTLATIVSQSAYMALMHATPVVLLGRMQLSGSGLVAEAPYRADLEEAVHTALRSTVPQEALRDHVARLMRYYVVSSEYGEKGAFDYDLSDVAASFLQAARQSATNHPT